MAKSALAGNASGHAVRGAACVRFLPGFFLASTHQRALPTGNQSGGALFSPRAYASAAVSARNILGAAHQQEANIYSRANAFPRRVVLLSGCLSPEIAAGVFDFAIVVTADCDGPKVAPRGKRSGHFGRGSGALAGCLGELACFYGCLCAQSAGHQHSALQRAHSAADFAARAISADPGCL